MSPAREAGPVQGILLVALGLLSVMAVVLLAPAIPAMQKHFAQFPDAGQWVTFSLTCPALCMALLSPFAGAVIDRLGRRRLLIASLIFYAIVGTAPLYLDSLPLIIASRLGVGLAETVLMTASLTMLGDLFHGRARERYLALNGGIASLSATAFFAIGGLLATRDWRLPYAIYGLALVFLIAVVLLTWEPPRSAQTEAADIPASDGKFHWVPLLAICVVTVAGGIAFMMPQINIGAITAAHGHGSPAIAGAIGAIGSIAMPVGAFVFNLLRKHRVSAPWLVILAFLLSGSGLVCLAHASTLKLLAASMMLQEFGCGFMLPGLMTWTLGLLPYELRGRGTGAYMTSFFIAQPICGFLFGVVEKAMHGQPLPATAIFGYAAIGCAVLVFAIGSALGALGEKLHEQNPLPPAVGLH